MKTWIDRAHFLELYAEGKIKSVRVQRVGGGYVLYYRLDAPGSKEAPLLKSRTKSVYVWTTLDSLVVWVCEFTNFKTLTISLEPNL